MPRGSAGSRRSPSSRERQGTAVRFAFRAPDAADAQETGIPILGFATLEAGALRVETNSTSRADALRLLVESHCGELLRQQVREHVDPTSVALLENLSGRPLPEAKPFVRDWKARHCAGWSDEPLPALQGRAPEGERFDFSVLRRELGLLA